jgi:NADPH-dependent curcumin reductase CurA
MTINRQWRLAKRPVGMVGRNNFEFSETTVPKVQAQQILIKNLYFSFDPTQRGWMVDQPSYLPPVGIGEVMRAGTCRSGCAVQS